LETAIDKLVAFLQQQQKPFEARYLLAELGLQNTNPTICQRIIQGIVGDDPRLTFIPGKGWGLAPIVTEVESLPPESVVQATDMSFESGLTAVVIRLFPQQPLIGQIYAQRVLNSEGSASFGPYTLTYDGVQHQISEPDTGARVKYAAGIKMFREFLGHNPALVWRKFPEIHVLNRLAFYSGQAGFEPTSLALKDIVRFLFPERATNSFADYLSDSNWSGVAVDDIHYELEALIMSYQTIGTEIQENYQLPPRLWLQQQQLRQKQEIKFDTFAFDHAFLEQIPTIPGIYLMKNKEGAVLYIGKSRNLHSRVNSYFLGTLSPKVKKLFAHLHQIEYFETGSELSAEINEAILIDKYRPPYNIQVKFSSKQLPRFVRNLFCLLPTAHEHIYELHQVNEYGCYQSIYLDHHTSQLPQLLEKVLNFYQKIEKDQVLQPEEKICYAIFLRWWRRNKHLVPIYNMNHLHEHDVKKILQAVHFDEFDPTVYFYK